MPNNGLNEERRKKYAQTFISRSNLKHGNIYNYEKAIYINRRKKVEIVCEKHGSFWKLPQAHESGEGCPYCNNRAKNTEIIVEEFKAVHGDRYDYSEVEYTKAILPVIIKCKIHGAFEQAPSEHKRGKGCMKCCNKQRSDTIKEMLARKRKSTSATTLNQ